ncbi:hypothetical protein B0H11DRAFT_2110444 [Mycena galericulata]|nr:hypothetical protein B0H11DRAFT_2110444 [Mycena galericulata]
MPSTTRGNPGEVIGPKTPSPTPTTIFHPTSLPSHRPRPLLVGPRKPPNKTRLRLQFLTLPRRLPPHSSRAACARFRLAKKKPTPRQSDIATSLAAAVEQFEDRMRRLIAQLKQINDVLLDAAQNISYIPMIDPASSSSPPSPTSDSIQRLVRISQCGLATRSAVAPPETSSRALPPPRPLPEDAIT